MLQFPALGTIYLKPPLLGMHFVCSKRARITFNTSNSGLGDTLDVITQQWKLCRWWAIITEWWNGTRFAQVIAMKASHAMSYYNGTTFAREGAKRQDRAAALFFVAFAPRGARRKGNSTPGQRRARSRLLPTQTTLWGGGPRPLLWRRTPSLTPTLWFRKGPLHAP